MKNKWSVRRTDKKRVSRIFENKSECVNWALHHVTDQLKCIYINKESCQVDIRIDVEGLMRK